MRKQELMKMVRNGMVVNLDGKSLVELNIYRRKSALVSICIGFRGICGCLRKDYETKELYATTTRRASRIFC